MCASPHDLGDLLPISAHTRVFCLLEHGVLTQYVASDLPLQDALSARRCGADAVARPGTRVRVHHFVPSNDSRRRRARLQLLPSQGVYNAAIAAAAHAKRLQDIMFFLGEMKLRGMTPDARCFNIAISAICRAGHTAGLRTGHYDAALQLLADMRAAGVTPNLWTYTALLTACAAHGRLDDAAPCEPHRESIRVVVPSVTFFAHRSATEFASPDDQSFVEQAPLFEVF